MANLPTIMNLPKHLLPTTVVGSYPQPEWLVRSRDAVEIGAAHAHACDVAAAAGASAGSQDDATIVAIRDMERAGIDIVTDGGNPPRKLFQPLCTALEGIDADNPAMITARNGRRRRCRAWSAR